MDISIPIAYLMLGRAKGQGLILIMLGLILNRIKYFVSLKE